LCGAPSGPSRQKGPDPNGTSAIPDMLPAHTPNDNTPP
jgi:hypothetical protein